MIRFQRRSNALPSLFQRGVCSNPHTPSRWKEGQRALWRPGLLTWAPCPLIAPILAGPGPPFDAGSERGAAGIMPCTPNGIVNRVLFLAHSNRQEART
jgi:hypothetical protein